MKRKGIKITVGGNQYVITPAQLSLFTHLRELGYVPVLELRVCSDRLWRFDIAIPDERLAFECNGGKWHGGHRRSKAVDDENEKLNRAQLEGWRVLQFTNEYILAGKAKQFLKSWMIEELSPQKRRKHA